MALLQCIFIITLQASICSQNTLQADLLPDIDDDSSLLSSTTSSADAIPIRAKDRLGRIKWENIAFMGFQAWFFGMAVDAVSLQVVNWNEKKKKRGANLMGNRRSIKTLQKSWCSPYSTVSVLFWVHWK